MWKCHKCGKPVYFAERKQSLGYDWHPECLRCEECHKRLNPGQHAEHKGEPYCYVPCYNMLFGPVLFGHGSQVESHNNFGKMEKKFPPGADRAVIESKLKTYNQYYEGNSRQLKWRERNGKLILEGVLRIYWGVRNLIHLKENDDQRHHVQIRKRFSYHEPRSAWRHSDSVNQQQCRDHDHSNSSCAASQQQNPESQEGNSNQKEEERYAAKMEDAKTTDGEDGNKSSSQLVNGNDATSSCDNALTRKDVLLPKAECPEDAEVVLDQSGKASTSNGTNAHHQQSNNVLGNDHYDDYDEEVSCNRPKRGKVDLSHVQVRKLSSSRSKTKLKRRCSINGHYYNRETKTFTPPFSSASNVWVTSMVNTTEVINMLLDKFRVENNPNDFALYVVKDNGETRQIREDEYPLCVRVLLGPHEDVAKVFIMDKKQTSEISNEVAQYLNFQEPELVAILNKFYEEEQRAIRCIKIKYREMMRIMKSKIADFEAAQRL